MSTSATLPLSSAAAPRDWIGRAAVVLVLSLAAHAVVLGLGQRALQVPALGLGASRVIEVTLTAPEQVAAAAVPPPAAAPSPRPVPAAKQEAAAPAAADPAQPEAPPAVGAPAVAETSLAPTARAGPDAAAAEAAGAGVFDASADSLLAALARPPLGPAALPVSARYVYTTKETRYPAESATTTVEWRFDENRRYSAALVTMAGATQVRELKSTGHVGPFGLAPERYTERTAGRPQWATNFDWDARRVSFSAKDNAHELREGVQDRLSFQFQLMALGQRLLDRFHPGATIVLAVGGRDDIVAYRMHVVGHERVSTGAGDYDTVKLERRLDAGSRESGIEIWLAPEAAWLPVKLRFSGRRGDVTESVLSAIALPAQ